MSSVLRICEYLDNLGDFHRFQGKGLTPFWKLSTTECTCLWRYWLFQEVHMPSSKNVLNRKWSQKDWLAMLGVLGLLTRYTGFAVFFNIWPVVFSADSNICSPMSLVSATSNAVMICQRIEYHFRGAGMQSCLIVIGH